MTTKQTTQLRRTMMTFSIVLACCLGALAQQSTTAFEPVSGQPGKDVVWVPTPEATVEKMLDVAKVTPQDYVIDLGSGDGRNVIGAAKRGAHALGVEWEQNMVDLSKRRAMDAGVADRAEFVRGDMYEADISKASVMALFLLPHNMTMLLPKFLALQPGSRIVSNTFAFGDEGWQADEEVPVENCQTWCKVLLWIVPANAGGTWQLQQGTLTLTQKFQNVSGTLGSTAIADGKLHGSEITFSAGSARYSGRIDGNTMQGTVTIDGQQQPWRATRMASASIRD